METHSVGSHTAPFVSPGVVRHKPYHVGLLLSGLALLKRNRADVSRPDTSRSGVLPRHEQGRVCPCIDVKSETPVIPLASIDSRLAGQDLARAAQEMLGHREQLGPGQRGRC